MEGRATGGGTGIVNLAAQYVGAGLAEAKNEEESLESEGLLQRIHAGGDVAPNLRIIYYDKPEGLASLVLAQIDADQRQLQGAGDDLATYELWGTSFKASVQAWQVLTPHRGELHGIEAINAACQKHVMSGARERAGTLEGVMLFNKVIQFKNRTRWRPLYAWDATERQVVATEVFNGELGLVSPHGMDSKVWRTKYFRLKRFQVRFARKEHLAVGYGRELGKGPGGKWVPSEKVEENLELGYAISVHKAQGSEFERTYVIVPASGGGLMSRELFYTALTRARKHCTLFVERDVAPLLSMRRRERSVLATIRSSLFGFRAVAPAFFQMKEWYAEGKIHHTLAGQMVRSKSEVIVANLLFERRIPFEYEMPAFGDDGTFYLPDFTVTWRGEKYYWEHVGMLNRATYKAKWDVKKAWYAKHHPNRLVTTVEGGDLTTQALAP